MTRQQPTNTAARTGTETQTTADGTAPRQRGFLDAVVRPFRSPASAFTSSIIPPRLALIELGIFALIVLLEWQVDKFPDISRINPHPYWLFILLLSLQYGVISGLMASAIAIVGAVLIGLPPPDVEERYFNYLLRVWSEPILWLLIALLLGTFRTRQIEKVRWLIGEARDLEMRGATVVANAAHLKSRIEMLERKLAVRDVTPQGRLLEALGRLGTATPGRWVDDFATVADLAFPGAALTLFAADEKGFHAVVRHGWPEDAGWRKEIALSEPLAQAILPGRRTLNVGERADEAILGSDGLAAVPVQAVTAEGRQTVVGMLKLEAGSATILDEDTALRLSVLAAHAAPALASGTLKLVPVASTSATAAQTERAAKPVHIRSLHLLTSRRDGSSREGGPA